MCDRRVCDLITQGIPCIFAGSSIMPPSPQAISNGHMLYRSVPLNGTAKISMIAGIINGLKAAGVCDIL